MNTAILTKIIPHFALIIGMTAWASSFIGLKFALTAYSPFEVVAGRMLVASIICSPFIRPLFSVLKDKRKFLILLAGILCEPCLYFLFETSALRYTSSAQAGMVLAIMPLCVGFCAWILLKEKQTMQAWIGFVLAFFGVFWLSFSGESSQSAPNPFLGNMLELGAVFCGVGYTLSCRSLTAGMSPWVFTAAMAFGGTIFYIPLTFLPIEFSPVILDVEIPEWMPLFAIFYLGMVVSLLGYGFYNYGIAKLSATEAAAYINLIPVITLFIGVCFLQEHLTAEQYIASALILGGMVLSQCKVKHRNTAKDYHE